MAKEEHVFIFCSSIYHRLLFIWAFPASHTLSKCRRALITYVIFVSFFLKELVPVSPARVLSITKRRPSASLGLRRPAWWLFWVSVCSSLTRVEGMCRNVNVFFLCSSVQTVERDHAYSPSCSWNTLTFTEKRTNKMQRLNRKWKQKRNTVIGYI